MLLYLSLGANRTLVFPWPLLCAVVDGKDHNSGFFYGIHSDEGCIRNDQLAGAGNPASPARHGEGTKLLNATDDLHRDPCGNQVPETLLYDPSPPTPASRRIAQRGKGRWRKEARRVVSLLFPDPTTLSDPHISSKVFSDCDLHSQCP